jgi:PleD family two-component response regulator
LDNGPEAVGNVFSWMLSERSYAMTKMPSILVVDDEAAIRESLKDWLMEDGYSVTLAVDGKDAGCPG